MKEIKEQTNLDRKKMIDLALLLGSDYTEGIRHVGTVTAIEILNAFPGDNCLDDFKAWVEKKEERILPKESKYLKNLRNRITLPEDFPSKLVREAYLNPVVDKSTEKFEWSEPDFEKITKFAIQRFGWSKEKIDELLNPVLDHFKFMPPLPEGQTSLHDYFETSPTKKTKFS